MTVAGNLLKSLGPNDQLLKAVGDLDVLLKAETYTITAQMNVRTSETNETVKQLSLSGMETQRHIIGLQQNIEKVSLVSGRIEERQFGMQETLNRVQAQVEEVPEKLLGLVSSQIEDTSRLTLIIVSDVQGVTFEELLNSIYADDFENQHNRFRKKRAPNSGRWFLSHKKFQFWAFGSSDLMLWCPGLRISCRNFQITDSSWRW